MTRLFVAVVFLCCLVPAPVSSAGDTVRLRVLSYNIHHGEGIDGKLDLERIARVIRSVDPDLVALQEVDRNADRSGSVDQPAELARLTGMEVVFGPNIPLQGGQYGNAVLTRFPVVAQDNYKLPNLSDGEQRGILSVRVRVPGLDRPLQFLATHLDHRKDSRERMQSAFFINRIVAKELDRPAILAGDLNAVPGSGPINNLLREWTRTTREPTPTIPVAKPLRQIDYVLFRPKARWKPVETRVLDEAVASDHRAILAVLEWMPEKP